MQKITPAARTSRWQDSRYQHRVTAPLIDSLAKLCFALSCFGAEVQQMRCAPTVHIKSEEHPADVKYQLAVYRLERQIRIHSAPVSDLPGRWRRSACRKISGTLCAHLNV